MPSATLKLFLVYGDPTRLRTAELSNWIGKAVAGPRSEFEKLLERSECESTGIYFLTGIDPSTSKKAIYIGEAENIRSRIKAHLTKDFWNQIAFFVSKDENLTKAHVKYLEGRLIELAKESGRAHVMNSQGSGARLPESDREEMEIFLEKMQQMLPALDVEAFVPAVAKETEDQVKKEVLFCKIKNVVARGYQTPTGFIVLEGSQAVLEERASAQKWPSVLAQRNSLIEESVLMLKGDAYSFTKNTEFSSPSAAAATIHGGSANGLTAWVDSNGKSLKQIEKNEA
ncbi:MAG: GIY-YIG nuclease family protein [Rubritalea sp.]|tara:strand:- start:10 stop:864 length:855 start_codon:yes stop_codon:yes gene_type:complete